MLLLIREREGFRRNKGKYQSEAGIQVAEVVEVLLAMVVTGPVEHVSNAGARII